MILEKISSYFSMVKFLHTLFALPFALLGFSIAIEEQSLGISSWLRVLLFVLLCMVFARNAAMAFNRYVDRKIDSKNPRTAFREIPMRKVKPRGALVFVLVNAALFTVSAGFLNALCLFFSPLALFIVLGYSYTKRFTALSHLILGLGLAIAPMGAYMAITASFSFCVALLSAQVLFWVAGFDVLYSLQDYSFDKQEKLYSIPSRYGVKFALRFSSFLHLLSVVCMSLFGYFYGASWLFWIGAMVFVLMLLYQHSLVKENDLSKVNKAFQDVNALASVQFVAFAIADQILC